MTFLKQLPILVHETRSQKGKEHKGHNQTNCCQHEYNDHENEGSIVGITPTTIVVATTAATKEAVTITASVIYRGSHVRWSKRWCWNRIPKVQAINVSVIVRVTVIGIIALIARLPIRVTALTAARKNMTQEANNHGRNACNCDESEKRDESPKNVDCKQRPGARQNCYPMIRRIHRRDDHQTEEKSDSDA